MALASFAVMVTALTGAVSAWTASGAAVDATLSIDPVTQTVEAGATFTVAVKQDVSVFTTLGTQTDVFFDQTRLQITAIQKGTAFNGSSFFMGVSPQSQSEAIAEANTTGRLRNVATSFSPGAGSVPPGVKTVFTLTMSAKATASGSSAISLDFAEMLGSDFSSLNLVKVPGTVVVNNVNVLATETPTVTPTPTETHTPTVTVTPGGPTLTPTNSPTNTPTNTPTNSPTQTPTNSPTNTPTQTPTGTLTPTTPTPSPTNTPAATQTALPTITSTPIPPKGSIGVVPATLAVSPNTEFTINLNQDANFTTVGTGTNIEFDPTLLQVVDVQRAEAFARQGASFVAGVVPVGGTQQTIAQAIAEANQTGLLKKVSAYYVPGGGGRVDTGKNTFLVIKMKSTAKEGTSKITLDHVLDAIENGLVNPGGDYAGPEMLDLEGNSVKLTATNGEVVVKAGSPPPPVVTPVVAPVSSPVTSSGTPLASASNSSTTLGASRPGGVSPSTASPSALPRAGEGVATSGQMLVLAIVAAMCTLGFGGLAAAGVVRQRRQG